MNVTLIIAVLALALYFIYQYAMLGIWFSEREKRNLAS